MILPFQPHLDEVRTITYRQLEEIKQAAFEAGAAAEREECAKLCDERELMYSQDKMYWDDAAHECAAAIRARGQK